jgi:hypothetical protein
LKSEDSKGGAKLGGSCVQRELPLLCAPCPSTHAGQAGLTMLCTAVVERLY